MKLRIRVNDVAGEAHTLRLDIPGHPDVAALQQHVHRSLCLSPAALAGFAPALPPLQLSFSLNKKVFFHGPPSAPVSSFGVCSRDLLHDRLEPAGQAAASAEPIPGNRAGEGSTVTASASAPASRDLAGVLPEAGSPQRAPHQAAPASHVADDMASASDEPGAPRPADAPEPMDVEACNPLEPATRTPPVPATAGAADGTTLGSTEAPCGSGDASLRHAAEHSPRRSLASQTETESSAEVAGAEPEGRWRAVQAHVGTSDAAAVVAQAVQLAMEEVGFVQDSDSPTPSAQRSSWTFRLRPPGISQQALDGGTVVCQVRMVSMGNVAMLVYAWCASTAGCSRLRQEGSFVQPGVLRVEFPLGAAKVPSPQASAPPSPSPASSAASPSGFRAQDGSGASSGSKRAKSDAVVVELVDKLALPLLHHCYDCAGLGVPPVASLRALPQEVLKGALFPCMDSRALAALCCASRDFKDAVEGAEAVWERLYFAEIPETDRVGWETPTAAATREGQSEQASVAVDSGGGVVDGRSVGAGRAGLWKACFAAAWQRKEEREAREAEERAQRHRFMGRRRRPLRPFVSPDPLLGFPRFMGDRRFIHGGDYDRLPGGAAGQPGPFLGGGFGLGGGGIF